MHDGRFKTLEEVLDHYSNNIQNNPKLNFLLKANGSATPKKFEFTAQQKADIIAFLNTLTDKNLLTDKKFSNPFN
jgi:cytochrome c peroxidase